MDVKSFVLGYTKGKQSGGGGGEEVEPIQLTGDCSNAARGVLASKYIELYGNSISTYFISNASSMFHTYQNSKIPFDLHFSGINNTLTQTFRQSNLTELPKMRNCSPSDMDNMFYGCKYIKHIPDEVFIDWDLTNCGAVNGSTVRATNIFSNCYSLRSYPKEVINTLIHYKKALNSYTYSIYTSLFNCCHALDEISDLGLYNESLVSKSGNIFTSMLTSCHRLKKFTFETNEDGSPKTASLSGQTIDLATYIGWYDGTNSGNYIQTASELMGIPQDKAIYDDVTYQALKNDPDSFVVCRNADYARYNHTSAVETINSLPDTTATVAANSGKTNTIKFKRNAGSKTDGGAIQNLTDSEIMVATSKGWTVTLMA